MSSGSVVLLTGATGFVGAHVARVLDERGADVHAFVRPTSRREALDGVRATWHAGDLEDAASIDAAAHAVARVARERGVASRLVHAAALISYRPSDAARSEAINVGGTARILDACVAHGFGRVVFVSSVVAVGQASDAKSMLDEDATYNGARLGSAYVSTKRAAEELVLARRAELDVVVVNPGAIFGAALEPSNTTRFLRSVASSRIVPPSPPGSLSVVGVEDVAEGIALGLERGARGRRYLLTESNWRVGELFALVLNALGRRARTIRVPRPIWRGVVGFARAIDRLRPFEVAAPEALHLLGEHYRFDSRRAREELGWSPRPFPEVLARTLEWMRSRELIA